MKQTLLMVGIFGLLTGCATAHLSDEGKHVRMVSTSPTGCKYISEVTGYYKRSASGGIVHDADVTEFARLDLKNETAKVGGDTVEIIRSDFKTVLGEAYHCGNK